MLYIDKRIIEGDFVNNRPVGKLTIYDTDGTYTGYLKDWQPFGEGVFAFKDGALFGSVFRS
jgi:hypothetical protein